MEPEKLTATNRPIWATFSVALLSVAGVILLRWLLTPILGDRLQFITLSGGVAIAVWFGGWGPGVLAAIAGYALAQYLFILPRHSFDPRSPDLWAGLALYSFSCGIIIFMGEALRRARKRLEHHSSRLEQVIAEREQTELALAESGRRREVLYEFVERRHRATSLTDIYDSALDAVLRAVRCDRASISLLDDAGVAGFVAWRDLSDAYRETIEGHSAWKVDEPNPEPVWIPDVDAAKIEDSLGPVTKKEGIRALVFIPLVAEGKLIGKFTVYYNAPHVFDNEETELILTIARQLALGIERKRAEEKLSANEERLRLATQTGKMGIWEWDIPNNRISWTDSLFLMHGLTKDEFDGTVEAFGALVHPDDHESVSKAIERSLKDGVPYEITFRSVKSDGEIIWVFTNAVVLRSNGKVVRMIGATTDITELKRVEEALEKAKGEAEDANRAKDKFLAALSHELRTPLTPVLMTAAALEDDRTIATDLREQFGMVRRNIELEARLIDDLLDISRIAHGKLELQKEDVD
ncbi:MAG: PAS domain-containing protein, partial [Verrucomicrobiota bacterium]